MIQGKDFWWIYFNLMKKINNGQETIRMKNLIWKELVQKIREHYNSRTVSIQLRYHVLNTAQQK